MIPEYRGWSHRHVEFVPKQPPTISASSDPSKTSLASRISKPIHIRSYSWAWLWILNHIPFKRSTMAVPYTYTTHDPKHPEKTKKHHYYLDAKDVKALISREKIKQSPDITNQEEISDNTLEEVSQDEIPILTTQLGDLAAGRIHAFAPRNIRNTFQPQGSPHHTFHPDSDSEADSESEGPPPYPPPSQYQRQQSMEQEPPPYSSSYSSASSQPHGANAARQTPQQPNSVTQQPQPPLSPPKPESSSSQAPAHAASAVQMPINLNRDQEDVWRLIYGSRILEGIQAAEGKMTAQDSIWSLFMSKVPSQVLDDELTEELHKSMGNVLHYIAHSQVNQGFLLLLLADCVKGGLGDVYMTIGYLSKALSVLQRFSASSPQHASFLQTPIGNGVSAYEAILKMMIQGWSVNEDAALGTQIKIKGHSRTIFEHIFNANPSQQAILLTKFIQCIKSTGQETITFLGELRDDLKAPRPPSAATSWSSSSSSSSSAPSVQAAPQPAVLGPLAQSRHQAYMADVRTAAQTIQTTSEYTFPDMERLIERKRKEMTGKSVKELQDLYQKQSATILEIIALIQKSLDPNQIPNEGRDSVNRWFLTDPQFSQYLSNYRCMDAIFALEALAEKDKNWMSFLTVFPGPPPTRLNDMIAFGLKDNSPAALESLPLNVPRPGQVYLDEYMRRKQSIESIINIVEALDGKVTQGPNPQEAHTLENWPTYHADLLLRDVLRDIREISQSPDRSQVLQSVMGHSLQNYQREARDAFSFLCQFQPMTATFDPSKKTENFTFKEFVDLICTSPGLLHPSISHDMDRLHLLAALMDEQKDIVFKNGAKASPKDIYIFVFEKLAKEPTPEHAIAAEQFYVRLKMIDDHLKSFA